MESQPLVQQIAREYEKLGVPFTLGPTADVEIHAEFLNARWSIGQKKYRYDALIKADENEKTLFFWQKTTESGGGLSLNLGVETTVQRGATAFRRVKFTQYGPEGKAAELELDLGEIVRIAQNAAKQNGWAFQTALRQEQAKR